ncbi:hypothetical protein GGX14DRAFT_416907, partial [Mycena pura]
MVYRRELVDGIIKRLAEVSFIQLRGTPASGKTILLHLIQRQLETEGTEVIRYDEPWPIDQSARKELRRELANYHDTALKKRTKITILIDEAQATFPDTTLWNTYFKTWAGDFHGFFGIIIACSYGSSNPHMLTPGAPILEDVQRIGLRRTTDAPLGLLFSQAEVNELLDLAISLNQMPRIDEPLRQQIFQWTQGYSSVVTTLVKMIGVKKCRDGAIFTLHDFTREYPPETLFSTLVANGQCGRFLPRPDVVADPRLIRVFSKLFVDKEIIYEENEQFPGGLLRSDLDFAHEKSLLYIEHYPNSSRRCISFIFPLQRGLLQMRLQPPIPDHLEDAPSLFALVTQVIKMFNPDHLTSPKQVDGSVQDSPLEATYQHEFYACLYKVRPRAIVLAEYSTAIGHTPAGRIDFLVHRREVNDQQRSWGIELLRGGDGVHEHAHRFDPSGAYHSMISHGMKEFIIVDFRTTIPVKKQPLIPDLIHVVFDQDYENVNIYDHETMWCMGFPLIRH